MGRAIKKYRPVLTAIQIAKILELAKTETPISIESKSLIGSLSPFLAKIEAYSVQEAYTSTRAAPANIPKAHHKEDYLGVDMSDITMYATREGFWEHCYLKFVETPTLCTLDEIEGAQEHRYLNDLMTPEEIHHFENYEQGDS